MLKMLNLYVLVIFSAVVFVIPIQLSFADSFTVNVPNSQGGYTAVVVQSSGNGYTGPRGEYYSSFPTVYQLQSVYGAGASNSSITTPANDIQPSQSDGQEVSVNISPDRAILIKKVDNGYAGPLGEMYSNFPTVQQLQINYGSVSDEQIQAANENPALKGQLLNDQVTRNMEAQTKALQLRQQQINQQIQQQNQVQQVVHPQQIQFSSSTVTVNSQNLRSGNNELTVLFIFLFCLYFIPSVVATSRKHLNAMSIFLVNLFLGWTFIGWVVALVWSCSHQQKKA